MEVITRQTNADVAADNWNKQYIAWACEHKAKIGKELDRLGVNPDPDEVDRIIGNSSWTRTSCDECGDENIPVVFMGKDIDFESRYTYTCLTCLNNAVSMLNTEEIVVD